MKKKKTIKAWAIFHEGKQENADYYAGNNCCCAEETNAPAIYLEKHLATQNWHVRNYPDNHKVVPCTITYELPTTKSKKKRISTPI